MLARIDAKITHVRVRNYAILFVSLAVLALLLNTVLGRFPVTATGQTFLPDFLAHWTGGRMILEGQAGELYDPRIQFALQDRHVAAGDGLSWFVGPPFSALWYVPLAGLRYGWAAMLWLALTLAALIASAGLAAKLLPAERREWHWLVVLVFAASAATFELLGSGQDSGLALLLWVIALRLLSKRRETASGLVLGLGLFKPQLFVFVPIVLLARRQLRALAAFVAVGTLFALLSWWLVGWGGIISWFDALGSPLYLAEVQAGQSWKMQSLSAPAAWLGAPNWVAYVILLVGMALLAWLGSRKHVRTDQLWATVLLTTVSFSPHVVSYDLVVLFPALGYLFTRMDSAALRILGVAAFALGWTEAARHVLAEALGGSWAVVGAPWSALVLAGIWWLALRWTVNPSQAPLDGSVTSVEASER